MQKKEIQEIYFNNVGEWRAWLEANHLSEPGVYLILYKVGHEMASMRWEDAVKVALCFGWIDSTSKSLGDGKRRQYFTRRKPKSSWSALNKSYLEQLIADGLMHESGMKAIATAKENGSWTGLDAVENGVIPEDLQTAFDAHPQAYNNFVGFARTYQKSYLYWLNQAKMEATRRKRIGEIIDLCERNIKSRD